MQYSVKCFLPPQEHLLPAFNLISGNFNSYRFGGIFPPPVYPIATIVKSSQMCWKQIRFWQTKSNP